MEIDGKVDNQTGIITVTKDCFNDLIRYGFIDSVGIPYKSFKDYEYSGNTHINYNIAQVLIFVRAVNVNELLFLQFRTI